MKDIRLIGAAAGRGAPDARCAQGPAFLEALGLASRLHAAGLSVAWQEMIQEPAGVQPPLQVVASICRRLAAAVRREAGHSLPVVIGGDHSCAIGTWSGVAAAANQPIGLLWIDAHLDAHTPQTSPSGALHGMPLACLLGYGKPELVEIARTGGLLAPQWVCLLGVRSWEPGERALLDALGVRIYFMEEIRQRGLEPVFREALARVRQAPGGYGISIDLDALDPQDAAAVGSPAPGGLRRNELLRCLAGSSADPQLRALEVAEFNPALPGAAESAGLMIDLLAHIFQTHEGTCYATGH